METGELYLFVRDDLHLGRKRSGIILRPSTQDVYIYILKVSYACQDGKILFGKPAVLNNKSYVRIIGDM